MAQPLTADDILPLVCKLSDSERAKLFRMLNHVSDSAAYRALPPREAEFSAEDDNLAWDADDWEDVG